MSLFTHTCCLRERLGRCGGRWRAGLRLLRGFDRAELSHFGLSGLQFKYQTVLIALKTLHAFVELMKLFRLVYLPEGLYLLA